MNLKKYLNYEKIEFLNEGFRSKAYKIDNKYIFLEGINENSYNSFKKDKRKINLLKDKITRTNIPNNIVLVKKDKQFKFGGLLYPIIQGKVFKYEEMNKYDLKEIAESLTDFLNQLHSIHINYNKKEILNEEKKLIKSNILLLKKYLKEIEFKNLLNWKRIYFKYLDSVEELSVIHGDLWYENLILSEDGQKLNGVIDFENMATFIRGVDLVPALYISENFLEYMMKDYKYKITKQEVYLLYQRREISSFKQMVENFPEEIEEQLDKIKNTLE